MVNPSLVDERIESSVKCACRELYAALRKFFHILDYPVSVERLLQRQQDVEDGFR